MNDTDESNEKDSKEQIRVCRKLFWCCLKEAGTGPTDQSLISGRHEISRFNQVLSFSVAPHTQLLVKICDFTASGQSLNWFLEKATMFAIRLILYHKLSCWKRGTILKYDSHSIAHLVTRY